MKKIEYGFNPGQRFGCWTILDRYVFSARGEKKYLCRCDCGTERYVLERSLKYGGSQSCGCLRKERAYQATAYNLLGQTFGELRVIGRSRKRTEMGAYWTCLCSCGYTCEATAAELVSGRKTHCGCKSVRSYATSNITGQRFGRLTAMYPTKKRDAKGFVIWHCRCDCGNEPDVSYNNLMYCGQQSCGCRKKEHQSQKPPRDNTTGYKGVYQVRGKYLAKIVFQKKQYFLGTYDSIEEAAAARKSAEALLFGETAAFIQKWKESAAKNPEWAGDNPVEIHVSRDRDGRLAVSYSPQIL